MNHRVVFFRLIDTVFFIFLIGCATTGGAMDDRLTLKTQLSVDHITFFFVPEESLFRTKLTKSSIEEVACKVTIKDPKLIKDFHKLFGSLELRSGHDNTIGYEPRSAIFIAYADKSEDRLYFDKKMTNLNIVNGEYRDSKVNLSAAAGRKIKNWVDEQDPACFK